MAEEETKSLEDLGEAMGVEGGAEAEPEVREPKIDAQGRSYATGRRKNAVARVWIKPGNGKITVNGREFETYFARPVLRMVLQQPIVAAERVDQFDVVCTVTGGGLSGQAGAVRHGLARALTYYEPGLRTVLKRGGFLTRDAGPEMLSWLFWQMGSAPYLGGGFGHFYAYAPEKWKYPIDRFAMEAKRQLDVLDRHLAGTDWMAGGAYTIADMAIWAWYGQLVLGRLYDAAEFLDVASYENVTAWAERIDARPAVRRGRMVNRTFGAPEMQLRERHSAGDFQTGTQAEQDPSA